MPMTSELIAETYHVDERIDVDVDFDLLPGSFRVGRAGGLDVDVANLSVEHYVICQHIVHADLGSQTPGVFHVEATQLQGRVFSFAGNGVENRSDAAEQEARSWRFYLYRLGHWP